MISQSSPFIFFCIIVFMQLVIIFLLIYSKKNTIQNIEEKAKWLTSLIKSNIGLVNKSIESLRAENSAKFASTDSKIRKYLQEEISPLYGSVSLIQTKKIPELSDEIKYLSSKASTNAAALHHGIEMLSKSFHQNSSSLTTELGKIKAGQSSNLSAICGAIITTQQILKELNNKLAETVVDINSNLSRRFEQTDKLITGVSTAISSAATDEKELASKISLALNRTADLSDRIAKANKEIGQTAQNITRTVHDNTSMLLDSERRASLARTKAQERTEGMMERVIAICQEYENQIAAIDVFLTDLKTIIIRLSEQETRMANQESSLAETIRQHTKIDNDLSQRIESTGKSLTSMTSAMTLASESEKELASKISLALNHTDNLTNRISKANYEISQTAKDIARTVHDNTSLLLDSERRATQARTKAQEQTDRMMARMIAICEGYEKQIATVDTILSDLQPIASQLSDQEFRIAQQESSLADTLRQHTRICEITHEMNRTSHEILEFMKLYLLKSTIDPLERHV